MAGGFHAPIGPLTEVAGRGDVSSFGCDAGQCVEGEDFDMGVVITSGLIQDGDESSLGARFPIGRVHRREQAFAERGLFATAGGAVPRSCRFEGRARLGEPAERSQDAPEMNPGEGRSRTSPVASALSIAKPRVAAPAW